MKNNKNYKIGFFMTHHLMYLPLISRQLTFILLLSLISTCLPVQAQTIPEAKKTYIFGIVPQFEARRLHKIWRPILNYLQKETGYTFKIKGSPTIPDFEQEFMQGNFDFAYMNPYHIMLANQNQGYIPLIRDVGKTLHGVLVVKKDSGINNVAQLAGKVIAFPAPNALGASLLMRQELQDNFHIKIKPVYVKTHDSVYLNVLLGRASAGGGVQKTLSKQKSEYKSALNVLHKTREIAPHPLAAHPRVPESITAAVKAALIKLGQSPEGAALLAKIPMKKIGESSMADYLPLKDLGLERFFVQ